MTTQFSSFEIDTSQVIRQLELLGYHRGGAVYVRAFLPKEDPRYAPNTGRKADKLNFKQILHWQQQGYGIYFVINGGGHKDEDVQLCRAVFIEHDDLEIELQRDLWQTLSLPQPTFQVQTRKSVHSYWVFEKPIPVQEWKQLQTDLLTYTGADPVIKNPSRVMRLAGAWHIKPGEKPLRCNIISESGIRYTYEELRSCVPVQQHPKFIQPQVDKEEKEQGAGSRGESSNGNSTPPVSSWGQAAPSAALLEAAREPLTRSGGRKNLFRCAPRQEEGVSSPCSLPPSPCLCVESVQLVAQASPQEQQYTRYQDISVPVPVAVPLEVCLSKESRALLNFGVNEGVRNTNGAKLARDLIGTANHLTTIGQRFDGDSQQLLQDYANRCTPPLPAKEVDTIWKSAEKDHPDPSCTPEGVETCIKAWYWNTYIKLNQNPLGHSGSPGNRSLSNVSSVGKKSPVSDVALRERILQILGSYDSESMRAIALMDLAASVGLPYRQIEQLAKLLTNEVDLQTDTLVATQKLSSLLKTCPQQLDLTRLLEPRFARLLIDTANAMPTAPEFLFTTLLGTAASVVGSAARVIVKPSGKYTQPLVMWTSIVAGSGSVKTPAQRVIIDPLVQLEAEAFERYQIEAAEYNKLQTTRKGKKQDDNSPEELLKAPVRQRYLTKDSTLETLQRIHSENPRGLLYYRDELAGLFKARNQYRGGLGADEEQELDQFNGSAIIYDRSEKSVCLPKSAISRTGSIQWEVLAAMMGDHNDYNGNFARWLFCAAKSPKRYLRLVGENTVPDTGISEALRQLYIKLALVPEQDYFLSTEAAMFFEAWQHSLVDAQEASESYGLRVVYAKIEAYTARLALWLHIVNAVLRGETPTQVISGDTMSKAIELGAYFLWQHKLIHAQNSPESGLMSWGLKIQKVAERLGGATASMLKSGIRAFRKKPTFEIRGLMEMMAAAGWGRIEDKGSNLVYVPNGAPPSGIDKIDRDLTQVSIAQTCTNSAFDSRIDSVDTILAVPFSSKQVTSCHLDSSLGAENVNSRQFVNSTAQMPTAKSVDLIDTLVQSGCQLSTDELSNTELTGDRLLHWHLCNHEAHRSNDNVPYLVESGSVPTLLPLDGESALFVERLSQEKTGFSEVCQEEDPPGKFSPSHVTDVCASAASSFGEAYSKDSSGRADGESVSKYLLQASTETVAPMTADSALPDAIPQTEQDLNPTAIGSNLNNRKLQPVEVLTAAGEWIRGYFIDACVRIANLVGVSQQFTLFNADGTRYTFVGQIRPAPLS